MIVVGDEGVEIGVSFGMVEEASVMGGAVLRHLVEVFAEAAVEAFDHAVGLRPEGSGQAVSDMAAATDEIEVMAAGGFVFGFAGFVDGEAVGELGAVIGQDGVDWQGKGGKKAFEEGGGGLAAAIGQDFEVDKAGGAVDGDIGVASLAAERRQVFDVDVDEAGRGLGFEGQGGRLLGPLARGDAVSLEAAVDGAARERRVETAAHRLDDVVEREREGAAQFETQRDLPIGHRGGQPMRHMRAVMHLAAATPAGNGAGTDAELAHQAAGRGGAVLDVGPDPRRRGRVGVQLHVHDARRSFKKPIACTNRGR
ncbi:hypothetical protein DYY66_1223 [Candidatus Nitrosotalea sp. FS]|nr:hypothetical protein [Candidatus Nitrosotalea sp. FS]